MGCLLAYLHRCMCGRRDGAALPVSWRDGLDADDLSSGSREPEVRGAGGGGRPGRGFTSRGGQAPSSNCPWVFTSRSGRPVAVDEAWNAFRTAAGLRMLRMHARSATPCTSRTQS